MKTKKLKYYALCAVSALALTACVNGVPGEVKPVDLTFPQFAPVQVNVAKVEVYDNFNPSAAAGHIEHEFPTAPDQAAKALLESKLQAGGSGQILRAYIDDASVISEKQPLSDGLASTFTRETSEIYRAHMAVRFELADTAAPDIVIGRANVTSDRTTSILENTSLADRDRAAVNLTNTLMGDVYAGLKGTVNDTFGFK